MLKPKRKKKCRHCGEYFQPANSMAIACSLECSIKLAPDISKKRYKETTRKAKKKMLDNDRSHWIKKAQAAFNAYVRERDKYLPCISCGLHHTGQYHAGHYLSTGAHPELRFHPLNNNKQCAPCNNHLSGNQIRYRARLIEKIGLSAVEWLEAAHNAQKWTIDDLKEIEQYYKDQKKLTE